MELPRNLRRKCLAYQQRAPQLEQYRMAMSCCQGSQAFANRFTLSVHYQFIPFSAV